MIKSLLTNKFVFLALVTTGFIFLTAFPAYSLEDVIIDNSDTESTSSTGIWSQSNGVSPFNTNSVWGQNNATFTWRFTCPQTGLYQLHEYHTVAPSRTNAAPLTIQNEGAPDTEYIDQTVAGGDWNYVGTYDFVAGVTYDVTITAAEYSTCADAVMFRLVEGTVPTAVIDLVSPTLLEGHGTPEGSIDGYLWESSLDGTLSGQASFTPNPPLTEGTHTISLSVRNTDEFWSEATTRLLTIGGGPNDIIIDNSDTVSTSSTGTWSQSNGVSPFNTNSVWGQNNATFTWRFTSPQTGQYQLHEYHTVAPSRTNAAPLTIQSEGAPVTEYIDQTVAGGDWNYVGTYDFVAGVTYDVTITAAEYSTCADAVMFRLEGTAPTAVIDLVSPTLLEGHGTPEGSIDGYLWESSLDGTLSGQASFTPNPPLTEGTHTISLSVRNTDGFWSEATTRLLTIGGGPNDIIIDNRDTVSTSSTGTWSQSNGVSPFNTNSVWGQNNATFTWHFTSPQTGQCELYEYHTVHASRTNAAPLTIQSEGAPVTEYIDQTVAGGDWNYVGTYDFVAGVTYDVTITAAEFSTCADAVMFRLEGTAPVAGFSASTNNLQVNFTDTSTGSITGWSWDFGDTNSSSAQNPTHTYAAGGTYTVSLTVTGPGGSDTSSQDVTVSAAPPPAPVAGFSASTNNLQVNFTDTSTGSITGWSWDFGDTNSSSAQNPTHTYAAGGTYTVSLTVTGPGGSDTSSQDVTVSAAPPPAPVAGFSASTNNLQVNFTDTSTGSITGWSWDFGDTNSSSAQNPTHTYAAGGTYTVSLTVTGPGGSDTSSQDVTVSAAPPPAPVAGFSASTNNLQVNFTDTSTGSITGWSWDFGDTNSSSAQNPTHTYAAGGTYTVSLTVTGPGGSDTSSQDVTVVSVPSSEPVAGFSATPTSANTYPLDVLFTDESAGDITGWSWDFGDTNSSSAQNPTHTYAAGGTYTVSLTVTGPGGSDTSTQNNCITINDDGMITEHIYACGVYSHGPGSYRRVLEDIGAIRINDYLYTYVNNQQNKEFIIHLTRDVDDMIEGLTSVTNPAALVLVTGHSNYGSGALPPKGPEVRDRVVEDFYYIDDVRILNMSSKWIAPSISGMIDSQPYPNWQPIFQDGTSGVMPFRFVDFIRDDEFIDPAYNYYITYKKPNDPTTYKIETVEHSAVQRFPGSGRPPWDPTTEGSFSPDPTDPDDLHYFYTRPLAEVDEGWNAASVIPGYYGSNYHTIESGTGDTEVNWYFISPNDNYQVFAFWPESVSNTTDAHYTVNDASGAVTVEEDQTVNGGQWLLLGEYIGDGLQHSIILTNEASNGNVIADAIRVAHPDNPTDTVQANFHARVRSGASPLQVRFRSDCTGYLTDVLWDFGDGSQSTGNSPYHTYTEPGIYTVTLTISGPAGSDILEVEDYIWVDQPPPIIQAEFDDSNPARPTGPIPAEVEFNDRSSSSGNIVYWEWDFDNNGTVDSTEEEPEYTYTSPGIYTVTLTVTDDLGNTDTKTKENFIRAVILDAVIDNTTQPSYHYGSRTMIHRKDLEIPKEQLNYSKLVYDACNSGPYYLDAFTHGTVFYSIDDVAGQGSFAFLREYITGARKTDYELWLVLQNVQPLYDYYNFNKAPFEQE